MAHDALHWVDSHPRTAWYVVGLVAVRGLIALLGG